MYCAEDQLLGDVSAWNLIMFYGIVAQQYLTEAGVVGRSAILFISPGGKI